MNDNDSPDTQLFHCQLLEYKAPSWLPTEGQKAQRWQLIFREGIALKSDFKLIKSQRINMHFSLETFHHFLWEVLGKGEIKDEFQATTWCKGSPRFMWWRRCGSHPASCHVYQEVQIQGCWTNKKKKIKIIYTQE